MKIFIVLSILLTFVFSSQAENYVMKLRVTHRGTDHILGKITGDLVSNNETHNFDFGPNLNIPEDQKFSYFYNSYPVNYIKFSWETESKMSLGLEPITISSYKSGSETNPVTYVPERIEISNGEIVIFKKNKLSVLKIKKILCLNSNKAKLLFEKQFQFSIYFKSSFC